MNYDIDYKIYEFDRYDESFNDIVKKDIGFKIYLLDIVTKEGSGVDAARAIREQYDDWVSVIIMLTSHQENLVIAMKSYDKKYKTLNYEYNHTLYKVEYRQIVYIEKEPDSKRCIIRTKEDQQIIPGTLNEVLEKLDDRFFKTHKSLIINVDEISRYEIKKNKITFKNGDHTHLISRNQKKELISRVSARS